MQLVWENLKAVLDNHKEYIGRIENTMFVAYLVGDALHVCDGIENDPLRMIRDRRREVDRLLVDAKSAIDFEKRADACPISS